MSAEVKKSPPTSSQNPVESEAAPDDSVTGSAPADSTSKANETAADAQAQPVASVNGDHADSEQTTKPAETTTDETTGAKVVAPESTPSSSKKSKDSKKRRSSTGIPEHKAKKPNQKKKGPELQLDAEAGDLYLALMKGFPKWPAVICDDEMLPETLLQNRPVTARRADGSYREDFLAGGKNARERTYPIMYLGTYEFSWMVNTNLKPLTPQEAKDANKTKMTKYLQNAYDEAAGGYDLDHFKATLVRFQDEREELEKEKAAKKSKKPKKSKGADEDGEDEDEEMPDADVEDEPPKSSSKKRKAADTGEDGEKKKMKLNLSKGSKTPSGEGKKAKTPASKSTKSEKKAKPAEPPMSEAEKRDKKRQATLYCRHKLQKAFLTSEVPPKEDQMADMAKFFDQLEKQVDDIDAGILKDTKIHKVMKGIVKLTNIPKDDEFHFKDRSAKLLESWNKLLGESNDKPRPSTANGEEAKTEDKNEEQTSKEAANESVEKTEPGDDARDEADDAEMPDADANAEKKADQPANDADAPQANGAKDGTTGAKTDEVTAE